MIKPKKNPVTKLVAAGVKAAMRGKKNSKGIMATANKDIQKLTTGRAKANVRNVKAKEFGVNITKGKNSKMFAKANKKAVIAEADQYGVNLGRVPASKTRKLKIGNTRTASPTSKGFSSGTKPVPVKKKAK